MLQIFSFGRSVGQWPSFRGLTAPQHKIHFHYKDNKRSHIIQPKSGRSSDDDERWQSMNIDSGTRRAAVTFQE